MSDDDLVAKYAAEAAKSIASEADKRIKETFSEDELLRLKEKSLFVSIEKAILSMHFLLDWVQLEQL